MAIESILAKQSNLATDEVFLNRVFTAMRNTAYAIRQTPEFALLIPQAQALITQTIDAHSGQTHDKCRQAAHIMLGIAPMRALVESVATVDELAAGGIPDGMILALINSMLVQYEAIRK